MKRARLWLRELSLTQQLLMIIFVFLSIFSLFIFTFLSPSLDSFSETEMFRLLHNSQEGILDSYTGEFDELSVTSTSQLISHGIYSTDGKFYPMPDTIFEEKLVEDIRIKAALEKSGTQDYRCVVPSANASDENVTYLYSMTLLKDGNYLVSVINNTYRTQFRTSLVNAVVYMNVMIVSILFVFLMIWVSTLIVPLNQIKVYINKIKNDEPATLNVKRQDAIGEVATALVDMTSELQKQQREKEEMVQNISHDLKTPIATIKSYGEAIKDGIYPYDTLEKSVDVIIEHADRLEKKVQSLILLNKVGYLQDEESKGARVDMNKVIDQVLLSLKMVRPEISLEKKAEKNVFCQGTEDSWRIVIENLMDNGLRYAQTHILVTLKQNELCVINDGKTIADHDLERIFRPYEKGTDGKFGLGLSIVHKVCVSYGYHVDAENLQDGVCFRIWKEGKKYSKKSKKTGEKK